MIDWLRRMKHTLRISSFHRNRWEKEAVWAQVFRDTTKDMPGLSDLALSPGRVAANYSLLYVIIRILKDIRPSSVVEFGLGQSTLMADAFFSATSSGTRHIVVEDNPEWVQTFCHLHSVTCKIRYYPVKKVETDGRIISVFDIPIDDGLHSCDVYIIDGPRGTSRYSRYTICEVAQHWHKDTQCIVVLDDYDRWGERETAAALIAICEKKGMQVTHRVINGLQDQFLLFTPKFQLCRTF